MLYELPKAIAIAYERYAFDLYSIGRTSSGALVLPDDDTIRSKIMAAAGRCGAKIGAGVKREKRELVFRHLFKARQEGADLTMTVVQNLAVSVLGRPFGNEQVRKAFATAGRSAKDKSAIDAQYLDLIASKIRGELNELAPLMAQTRQNARLSWMESPKRSDIIEEWREHRTTTFRYEL